ncbi:MAG TPA: hypothetical protein VGP44_07240 [Gemmatimonadales bacterium]|nr:hypothetical protein [Gemmatimonadales bacterium]
MIAAAAGLFARLAAGRGLGALTAEISDLTIVAGGAQHALRGAGHQMHELGRYLQDVAGTIDTLSRARLFSGGTAEQVGQMAAAFDSIGISAGNLSGVAHDLRERLQEDATAIRAFGRQVVPVEFGGPTNDLKILEEVVDQLRSTTNEEERLRKARMLGAEALLPMAQIEEKRYRALLQEGAIAGGHVDAELRQLRAEQETNDARERLLGKERQLEVERIRRKVGNWWDEHVTLPANEWINDRLGLRNQGGKSSPADRQVEAMESNTNALNAMRAEFANGGRRAQSAVPARLRGEAWLRGIDSESLKIGAFSL